MTAGDFPGARLADEHRRLDEMLGRMLITLEARAADEAREAARLFDSELRSHTALEEERLYPKGEDEKLQPREDEGERERLFRELRLEHVQIRELSGMILRLLGDRGQLESARRLLPNLLRRWDAHTEREEREAFESSES